MNDLSELKNFGPYMVRILNQIGIYSKDDLLEADLRGIYQALQEQGIKPHLLIFYSIEMGLQNRKWSDIGEEEKRRIRDILFVVRQ
ncbi:MAG: hypothetical protein RLZZ370_1426 [Bacteroidota bacterium]|jgi:hypothetical protein